MGKSMISDFVPLINFAPQDIRIGLPVLAHDKESRGHILLFQDVENARRPSWIGTVIKSEGNISWMIAGALDHVRGRNLAHVVRLRGDKTGVLIDGNAAFAGL